MALTTTFTLDQIAQIAPSTTATQPFGGMSSKYKFIPTTAIIERMMSEGFVPVKVSESRARYDSGKRGFQKHNIRFRLKTVQDAIMADPDLRNNLKKYDAIPEVDMTNSHDGSSTVIFNFGIFRAACANGMVVATSVISDVRVRHTGRADEMVEAAYSILNNAGTVSERVQRFRGTMLTQEQTHEFARKALALRYDRIPEAGTYYDGINLRALLRNRRDDREDSLWWVFNNCQETLIPSRPMGVKVFTLNDDGVTKYHSVRTVSGIDQSRNLNMKMWELAEVYAQ